MSVLQVPHREHFYLTPSLDPDHLASYRLFEWHGLEIDELQGVDKKGRIQWLDPEEVIHGSTIAFKKVLPHKRRGRPEGHKSNRKSDLSEKSANVADIRNRFAFLRTILGNQVRFDQLNAVMGGIGMGQGAVAGPKGKLAKHFGGKSPEAWYREVFLPE